MSTWTLRTKLKRLSQYKGFLPIAIAGILLYLPCLAFPPLTNPPVLSSLCQTTHMCTYTQTPWGIVTSLSLFDGSDNLITFVFCALMFVRISIGESPGELAKRSLFFLGTSFGIAIFSNFLWMVLNPAEMSYGQSGVVYSFMATVLALVCVKGLPLGRIQSYRQSLPSLSMSISSIAIFALLTIDPLKTLMFYGPGLNPFVHEITFFSTFLITVPFCYFRRARIQQEVKIMRPIEVGIYLAKSKR